MRAGFTFLALLVLAIGVFAWDKDDYEIFDLVRDLKADGVPGASFYEFMGVEPSATLPQIAKAYRKRSLELHPDKNRGVKGVEERFARLGLINTILRNPELRDRYNFFLKNGVPTWKGLGYAYTRWRPGLGLVLGFLVFLTAGFGYIVQVMNHKRDTKRVAYFQESALKAARGASGKRKVRVPMVEGAIGGDQLELVVEDGNVYLPHDDGTLWPLDDLAPAPSVHRTWPVVLARKLVARVTGATEKHTEHAAEVDDDVDEVEGFDVDAPRTQSRAAQLRNERKKKSKSSREATPQTTEGEAESESASASAADTDGEKRKRKPGPGKANAARRRKMGMK